MSTDVAQLDELTQIHGVVIVQDFREFSAGHVIHWSRDAMAKATKCWQVCGEKGQPRC